METIIGFVAGYLTGVSEGREGVDRARKSLEAIRTSPELRRMVGEGMGLAQGILGRVAKSGLNGALAGVREIMTRGGSTEERRTA